MWKGLPVLEDQRVLEVANVIWCIGFRPDFSWIDLPVFGEDEIEPKHMRGIVANEPGLYFVGLFFLYAASSGLVGGVGRDAEHVVEAITSRSRGERTTGGHYQPASMVDTSDHPLPGEQGAEMS
jgi:putative flavoprotein involved in K+ transport